MTFRVAVASVAGFQLSSSRAQSGLGAYVITPERVNHAYIYKCLDRERCLVRTGLPCCPCGAARLTPPPQYMGSNTKWYIGSPAAATAGGASGCLRISAAPRVLSDPFALNDCRWQNVVDDEWVGCARFQSSGAPDGVLQTADDSNVLVKWPAPALDPAATRAAVELALHAHRSSCENISIEVVSPQRAPPLAALPHAVAHADARSLRRPRE